MSALKNWVFTLFRPKPKITDSYVRSVALLFHDLAEAGKREAARK